LFQKGDIVRWFETYSDILIVKDTGLGIIVEAIELPYVKTDYISYRVYRLKINDYMSFGENDLEKLKGDKNELHTI
tara:strand:- start:339 stop:566 length:228 start_codon:yes stop_codon:yes gene_type:complete